MAKRNSSSRKPGRSDPKSNKSLAIRNVLKRMPKAKAADICAAVKKEYGQDVSQNMVYMVKTKTNMGAVGRKSVRIGGSSPMTTPALWVEAIKMARHLLKSTGGLANATALLKAVDG